jgi:hypothetical protein
VPSSETAVAGIAEASDSDRSPCGSGLRGLTRCEVREFCEVCIKSTGRTGGRNSSPGRKFSLIGGLGSLGVNSGKSCLQEGMSGIDFETG